MKNREKAKDLFRESLKKHETNIYMVKPIHCTAAIDAIEQALDISAVSGLLPSDKVIKEKAWNYGEIQVGDAFNKYQSDQAFKAGAIWMRDMLLVNNR